MTRDADLITPDGRNSLGKKTEPRLVFGAGGQEEDDVRRSKGADLGSLTRVGANGVRYSVDEGLALFADEVLVDQHLVTGRVGRGQFVPVKVLRRISPADRLRPDLEPVIRVEED